MRRELGLRSRLFFRLGAYFPHPEQDAQQSAEGQHEALAAFTAPVRPNATAAGLASGDTEWSMLEGVPHLRRSGIGLRTSQASRPGLTCAAPPALRESFAVYCINRGG